MKFTGAVAGQGGEVARVTVGIFPSGPFVPRWAISAISQFCNFALLGVGMQSRSTDCL